MTPEQWTRVDQYFASAFLGRDTQLEAVLQANAQQGLPPIDVSPHQGKLLYLFVKIQQARRVLEFGTLGGYSTICMARALPKDGYIVSLEADEKHAAVARENFHRCGVEHAIHLHVGPALTTLPEIEHDYKEPFDFIFIDADKEHTREYYQWALKLGRPGSVILIDNVVRKGEVVNAASDDERVQGMRRFVQYAATDPRAEVAGLQTVGAKGYDGFVMARIK